MMWDVVVDVEKLRKGDRKFLQGSSASRTFCAGKRHQAGGGTNAEEGLYC
jgi:hypothetical protein